jgi:hypothetical protein
MGPWKLIHYYGDTQDHELYNVVEDMTESKNRAKQYPERVAQMTRMLFKHIKDIEAQTVTVQWKSQ